MNSWKLFCMASCMVILSGCANDFAFLNSDLVTPPFEDHPKLKAAEIARARGDLPQAIHDYRDIIKECVNCEKAYIGLGMSLLDANAIEESKNTFDKAISLYPRSAEAYAGLGALYLTIDQPENAIQTFSTALKLNPSLAKALNGYAIALDMIGDHRGAQANYRAAMEQCPNNISYESNLGLSMALDGNTAEAIHILERLSRSPQVTPRVRQNLSLAYGLAGDMKMARNIGTVDLSSDWVRNNITYMEAVQETAEYAGLIPKNHEGPLNENRNWQDRNKN
ncbi:MAG: tetratricopeptide repeat protein [Alphaproteobacteria bacterium]|nr:tetratricopeptide repeat protein [Alphaproteobacteria bacterium]